MPSLMGSELTAPKCAALDTEEASKVLLSGNVQAGHEETLWPTSLGSKSQDPQ